MVTLRSITTHALWQDWCMWGLRSAGERDRLIRLHIVEIDKIGTKYSMHKIAHVKHWELHTSSSEGCIAYWKYEQQTDRQDERSDICVKAGLNDSHTSDVIKWTALCVCYCAQWKFTLNQLTDRIKGLVSGSTDETKGELNHSGQWCYQMNCILFVFKHTWHLHSNNWQTLLKCSC